jgi:hypothetical protein
VVWLFQFQARAAVPVPGVPSTGSMQTVRELKFIQVFFVVFAGS